MRGGHEQIFHCLKRVKSHQKVTTCVVEFFAVLQSYRLAFSHMTMAFCNLCFHFVGNEPGTDDIDEWQVIDQVQWPNFARLCFNEPHEIDA